MIYYISVLPIPNDDKLNPIVYKVKGTPDGVEVVEFDSTADGSRRQLEEEVKISEEEDERSFWSRAWDNVVENLGM